MDRSTQASCWSAIRSSSASTRCPLSITLTPSCQTSRASLLLVRFRAARRRNGRAHTHTAARRLTLASARARSLFAITHTRARAGARFVAGDVPFVAPTRTPRPEVVPTPAPKFTPVKTPRAVFFCAIEKHECEMHCSLPFFVCSAGGR